MKPKDKLHFNVCYLFLQVLLWVPNAANDSLGLSQVREKKKCGYASPNYAHIPNFQQMFILATHT